MTHDNQELIELRKSLSNPLCWQRLESCGEMFGVVSGWKKFLKRTGGKEGKAVRIGVMRVGDKVGEKYHL